MDSNLQVNMLHFEFKMLFTIIESISLSKCNLSVTIILEYKRSLSQSFKYLVSIIFLTIMNLATFNIFSSILLRPDVTLLVDIFKFKNIDYAINFHCDYAFTAVSAQKMIYKNKIRIANVNSLSLVKIPFSYHKIGLILNTKCENWSSIFDDLDGSLMFKSSFKWFIVTENLLDTQNVLSQYPIEIDSDVMIINKEDSRYYRLYEAYNTGFYTHGSFKVKQIGHWNSSLSLECSRRTDLSGVLLRAMVVVTQKVVNETFDEYVERSKLYKSDTLHKLKYFTLLKYLRDMYNFSYVLGRTNSWGYLHNGSFDGMIGTLQRNETDIGGSPIFFRLERARVVDATMEVWKSTPVFILRHPKHPGGYFTIFTRPLTNRVWGCILMVLATSSLILCLMLKLKVSRDSDDDASASLAVLIIWSAICQQGSTISTSSTSIKLVMFVTFVFALTIYQYYNATVVSTLLRDPPKNIRTPRDLLKSNLKAGIHDVLYNRDFFKHTTDPVALEMYQKKIVTPAGKNFFPLEYGMTLVKRGGFAFLVDNSIAYAVMRSTFNEAELCDAHEVALYPPQNMAAVVKKRSPYKEHFAYGLRKMFESGLMRRIKSVWDEPRPACVHSPDTSLISVSVREFATPLVALLVGSLLAATIMAAEIMLSGCDKTRFQK